MKNGLSDFGEPVVKEMNRLGLIIDVAIVSDKTFWEERGSGYRLETTIELKGNIVKMLKFANEAFSFI